MSLTVLPDTPIRFLLIFSLYQRRGLRVHFVFDFLYMKFSEWKSLSVDHPPPRVEGLTGDLQCPHGQLSPEIEKRIPVSDAVDT